MGKPELVEITSYTKEDLVKAFPHRKGAITDELVEIFNSTVDDPLFAGESLIQSAMTYEKAMESGKYKFMDYIRAVKFCAYLGIMKDSYIDSYKKAFYDRKFVQDRLDVPTDSMKYKELASASSRYRNSKLVTEILTYSQVPEHIFYAGHRMKAMTQLYDLMMTARSDMAKVTAAKEILANTKPPENIKMELEVGPNKAAMDLQSELNNQLAKLAANQKAMLQGGMDIREVQKTGIDLNVTDAEIVDE